MDFNKLKEIPHPGFRVIKTGIAIFICLTIYSYTHRNGAALATVATLICLQDSVQKSISEGRNRLIGSAIGGLFGIIFVSFSFLHLHYIVYNLACMIGIIGLMYICNLIKISSSISIACVVYLTIIIQNSSSTLETSIMYSINRMIDTFIGIVVAVVVNKSLHKPSPEEIKIKRKENFSEVEYEVINSENCKETKWSGGISTEIYISPLNSLLSQKDFDFRISILDIQEEKSNFNNYKDYMRHIMPIEGKLKLDHEGFHIAKLGEFSQDFFDADWNTISYGKAKCLNFMYKRGYYGLFYNIKPNTSFELYKDKITAFYCLKDNTTIVVNDYRRVIVNEILNKGDFLILKKVHDVSKNVYTVKCNCLGSDNKELILIKIELWK